MDPQQVIGTHLDIVAIAQEHLLIDRTCYCSSFPVPLPLLLLLEPIFIIEVEICAKIFSSHMRNLYGNEDLSYKFCQGFRNCLSRRPLPSALFVHILVGRSLTVHLG